MKIKYNFKKYLKNKIEEAKEGLKFYQEELERYKEMLKELEDENSQP